MPGHVYACAGVSRTTTLAGLVSEAVTLLIALMTASATSLRTAALRQAFGSHLIFARLMSHAQQRH